MIRILTLASGTRNQQIVVVVQVRLAPGSRAVILSPDPGSQVTVLDELAVEQLRRKKANPS